MTFILLSCNVSDFCILLSTFNAITCFWYITLVFHLYILTCILSSSIFVQLVLFLLKATSNIQEDEKCQKKMGC